MPRSSSFPKSWRWPSSTSPPQPSSGLSSTSPPDPSPCLSSTSPPHEREFAVGLQARFFSFLDGVRRSAGRGGCRRWGIGKLGCVRSGRHRHGHGGRGRRGEAVSTVMKEGRSTGGGHGGAQAAVHLSAGQPVVRQRQALAQRFLKIQREAPVEFQQNLVQVTKYHAAKICKTWRVGKWLSPRKQQWAPSGTHFHQFVVPPVIEFCRS